MSPSRRPSLLLVAAGLVFAAGCEDDDPSAIDDTGVYSLEQAPPEVPETETVHDETGGDTTPGDTAAPTDDGTAAHAPAPVEPPAGSSTEPSTAPGAGDQRVATPEHEYPVEDEAAPEAVEHRQLAADSPEMVAFQQEVVSLPAGFDGTVFTPPSNEAVTVANRSTDRRTPDEVVTFMRDALADAGWDLTDEREAPVGTVRLEAERQAETVTVVVQLVAARDGEPDIVQVTVEHTA
jgi:hypothetical protein